MRRASFLWISTLGLGLVLALPGFATTLAYEGFQYAPGELDGQNGGQGFAGAWTARTGLTEVSDPGTALRYSSGAGLIDGGTTALRITGNDDRVAFRSLATPILGDEVFVRFLFRYDGVLDNNDFGVLWHDNQSTGSHTDRPNLGVKGNRGDGSGPEDVVARLQLGGSGQVYNVDLAAGETYLLLGRLYKSSPGVTNDYDRFDVWVNPSAGASGTPDLTATGSGTLASFGLVGIRTANLDTGDSFWIDEIRYSTSFASAIVPEPSSALLIGAGLAALAARRRTARSRAGGSRSVLGP